MSQCNAANETTNQGILTRIDFNKQLDEQQSVGWNYLSMPNFTGAAVEAQEWVSNIIAHFIMDVITYAC